MILEYPDKRRKARIMAGHAGREATLLHVPDIQLQGNSESSEWSLTIPLQ